MYLASRWFLMEIDFFSPGFTHSLSLSFDFGFEIFFLEEHINLRLN